jgi:hypothetical protein
MDGLLNLSPNQLKEIISRVNAGYSVSGGSQGYGGGGRVGYTQPMGNDALSVGISGSGYKYGPYSDFQPTAVDATYHTGNNDIGLQYSQNQSNMRGQLPQEIQQNIPVQAPVTMENLLQLLFRKSF